MALATIVHAASSLRSMPAAGTDSSTATSFAASSGRAFVTSHLSAGEILQYPDFLVRVAGNHALKTVSDTRGRRFPAFNHALREHSRRFDEC